MYRASVSVPHVCLTQFSTEGWQGFRPNAGTKRVVFASQPVYYRAEWYCERCWKHFYQRSLLQGRIVLRALVEALLPAQLEALLPAHSRCGFRVTCLNVLKGVPYLFECERATSIPIGLGFEGVPMGLGNPKPVGLV